MGQLSRRIGFDARLALREKRGIGRSIAPLVRALKQRAPYLDLVCYVDRADTELRLQPWCTLHRLPAVPVPLWEQLILPWAAKRDGCQILHCPANSGALFWPAESLSLTVNDLIFLNRDYSGQGWYQRLGRRYWASLVPRLVARTARLQTISPAMLGPLENLANRVGRPAHLPRPMVMPLACDPVFSPATPFEMAASRTRFGLAGDYFLCLGARDPRKRTEMVVEAFLRFCQSSDQKITLVITGGDSRFQGLPHVRVLPFVGDNDLRALYSDAKALLFLSEAEGFGLPPLEAMACGCPVVYDPRCAAVSGVVGDAGLPVPTVEVDAIAQILQQILSEKSLKNEVIDKGFMRTTAFSWDNAAAKLLESWGV